MEDPRRPCCGPYRNPQSHPRSIVVGIRSSGWWRGTNCAASSLLGLYRHVVEVVLVGIWNWINRTRRRRGIRDVELCILLLLLYYQRNHRNINSALQIFTHPKSSPNNIFDKYSPLLRPALPVLPVFMEIKKQQQFVDVTNFYLPFVYWMEFIRIIPKELSIFALQIRELLLLYLRFFASPWLAIVDTARWGGRRRINSPETLIARKIRFPFFKWL